VSARSKARKHALDILYESDIRGAAPESILESREIPEEGPDARPLRDFTKELVLGVVANKRKIDELITIYAQGWDMDRLAAVDRNILRLGIFEIIWSDELEDGDKEKIEIDLAGMKLSKALDSKMDIYTS
jgi:N utilization substance protein B